MALSLTAASERGVGDGGWTEENSERPSTTHRRRDEDSENERGHRRWAYFRTMTKRPSKNNLSSEIQERENQGEGFAGCNT